MKQITVTIVMDVEEDTSSKRLEIEDTILNSIDEALAEVTDIQTAGEISC